MSDSLMSVPLYAISAIVSESFSHSLMLFDSFFFLFLGGFDFFFVIFFFFFFYFFVIFLKLGSFDTRAFSW